MARELPTIYFAGRLFTVDIQLEEFRQKDKPWNRISFDDMADTVGNDVYTLAFDKKTSKVYQGNSFDGPLSEHVVIIDIPSLAKLQPVALPDRLTSMMTPFWTKWNENKQNNHEELGYQIE